MARPASQLEPVRGTFRSNGGLHGSTLQLRDWGFARLFRSAQSLAEEIRFLSRRDFLWVAGDLVTRVRILRGFALCEKLSEQGAAAATVLGNHDLARSLAHVD